LAVADLDAFHARMTQHGVVCVQQPKAVFGVRIAQYLDPDGLVLSVSAQR
jgi:predicted enzyme related to lactoylglutathione lyase